MNNHLTGFSTMIIYFGLSILLFWFYVLLQLRKKTILNGRQKIFYSALSVMCVVVALIFVYKGGQAAVLFHSN